jgi:hypothetical protein
LQPKPNALFSPMFGRRIFAIRHRLGIYTIATKHHTVKTTVTIYVDVDADSPGVKDLINERDLPNKS